jgi:hypothetical protein
LCYGCSVVRDPNAALPSILFPAHLMLSMPACSRLFAGPSLLAGGLFALAVPMLAVPTTAPRARAEDRPPAAAAPGAAINVPARADIVPSPTASNVHASNIHSSAAAAKGPERLREGTRLIDVPGAFQSIGADRIAFSPTGSKDSYRVLENQALERVGRALDENRGPRPWIVSGTITEYHGANYLLVTKAVEQLPEGDAAGR